MSLTPFEVLKARIARGLLPEGYDIVKGEETSHVQSMESVEQPVEKNVLMARMDAIADRMAEIENRFSKGEHTYRDEMEYGRLDREYKLIHEEYKKKRLIKGRKAMPIGTISNGRKKIKEGVWRPIKESKSAPQDQFEKDYQQIKKFFLTFGEKNQKLETDLNAAHDKSVEMAKELWGKCTSGAITYQEYKKLMEKYHIDVQKKLFSAKEAAPKKDKFTGITDVLKQDDVNPATETPDYAFTYSDAAHMHSKGTTPPTKNPWTPERINKVITAVTNIVGKERMNFLQNNMDQVTKYNHQKEKKGDYDSTMKAAIKKYGITPASPFIKIKKGRAYARWEANHGRVIVSPYDSEATFAHELGHYIEFTNPDIHDKALKFLEKRTKGEKPQWLGKLTGNKGYSKKEVAKPDKFPNPYTGKIYSDTSTEIVSMWFTHVFQNPKKFIQEDEEYFKEVLSWFRSKPKLPY